MSTEVILWILGGLVAIFGFAFAHILSIIRTLREQIVKEREKNHKQEITLATISGKQDGFNGAVHRMEKGFAEFRNEVKQGLQRLQDRIDERKK